MLDKMGDLMGERLGLPRTRPRINQQRTTQALSASTVVSGAGLIRVEVLQNCWRRHGYELRSVPKLKLITICSGAL